MAKKSFLKLINSLWFFKNNLNLRNLVYSPWSSKWKERCHTWRRQWLREFLKIFAYEYSGLYKSSQFGASTVQNLIVPTTLWTMGHRLQINGIGPTPTFIFPTLGLLQFCWHPQLKFKMSTGNPTTRKSHQEMTPTVWQDEEWDSRVHAPSTSGISVFLWENTLWGFHTPFHPLQPRRKLLKQKMLPLKLPIKNTLDAYLCLPQEWSYGLQRFAFLKYYHLEKTLEKGAGFCGNMSR